MWEEAGVEAAGFLLAGSMYFHQCNAAGTGTRCGARSPPAPSTTSFGSFARATPASASYMLGRNHCRQTDTVEAHPPSTWSLTPNHLHHSEGVNFSMSTVMANSGFGKGVSRTDDSCSRASAAEAEFGVGAARAAVADASRNRLWISPRTKPCAFDSSLIRWPYSRLCFLGVSWFFSQPSW